MQRYAKVWDPILGKCCPYNKTHSKWAPGNSWKKFPPSCLKNDFGISDAVKKTKSFDKTRMTTPIWLCKNLVAMKTKSIEVVIEVWKREVLFVTFSKANSKRTNVGSFWNDRNIFWQGLRTNNCPRRHRLKGFDCGDFCWTWVRWAIKKYGLVTLYKGLYYPDLPR